MNEEKQRKLAIICSKGSLDMAYPGMVLANAALMSGIEVHMFFTFWGLDMITERKMDHLKITPLGNPSMGMPNLLSILPGMTAMATSMMKKEIAKLDFPPVREFLQMIVDAGGHLYGCKMSMDMMKLTKDDLFPGVERVLGAMEFMEISEGAQIIFI
ncbi:MAG: DsrE/DsrF/DrsH-like family protein [Anaerolineae bacterium]|nr:DsrE/DsrF/DrsH-like family protein [Anaerolineae bacterium]MDW8070710.1 DsrE/DsrF/DrsH-like family protein [Anaerolineae bacterium]